MRKRWWALGVLVLIIGAAGYGDSDSDRTGSENNSQESQRATPTPQEEEPQLTSGQEKALASARWRIDSEGLSKKALIQHLTAAGHSTADATFAANNVGADWKEEAVEQAQGRLGAEAYSKKSLFDHLAEADGFTRAQAEYAVNKVYD